MRTTTNHIVQSIPKGLLPTILWVAMVFIPVTAFAAWCSTASNTDFPGIFTGSPCTLLPPETTAVSTRKFRKNLFHSFTA